MNSSIKSSHETASRVFLHAFARLDAVALGVAVGCWSGTVLLGATWLLALRNDSPAVPALALLANYLPGFTVTWQGGVLGLLYGFVIGLTLGWAFARLRNLAVRLYFGIAKLKAAFSLLAERLDQ
jgi:ABC-type proline/glycine betaine transport system permease subunit